MASAACVYCNATFDPLDVAKGGIAELRVRGYGNMSIRDPTRFCNFVAGHTKCVDGGTGRYRCCDGVPGQDWACFCIVFPHSEKRDPGRDSAMNMDLDPQPAAPPKVAMKMRPCVRCNREFNAADIPPPGGLGNLVRRGGSIDIADPSRYCEFICEHTERAREMHKGAKFRTYPCCGATDADQSPGCRCVVLPHHYIPETADSEQMFIYIMGYDFVKHIKYHMDNLTAAPTEKDRADALAYARLEMKKNMGPNQYATLENLAREIYGYSKTYRDDLVRIFNEERDAMLASVVRD